ncbi:GGDEF domain-containing protein [Vibrio astriarenae]
MPIKLLLEKEQRLLYVKYYGNIDLIQLCTDVENLCRMKNYQADWDGISDFRAANLGIDVKDMLEFAEFVSNVQDASTGKWAVLVDENHSLDAIKPWEVLSQKVHESLRVFRSEYQARRWLIQAEDIQELSSRTDGMSSEHTIPTTDVYTKHFDVNSALSLFSYSKIGMWLMDNSRNVIRVNRPLIELWDKQKHWNEFRWMSFYRDVYPCMLEMSELELSMCEKVFNGEVEIDYFVIRHCIKKTDGLLSYLEERIEVKSRDSNNCPVIVAGICIEINDYKKIKLEKIEAERRSEKDGLTGLYNRRHFDSLLQSEWKSHLRSGQPLSVIMCDIDYFKQYNDTYGHQRGDDCLKLVARNINMLTKRSTDIAARYGGEEFVILLPNTDLKGASYFANLIKEQLAELRIPHATSKIKPFLSLSLGLATIVPSHEQTPDFVITLADRALYQSKENGRNKVTVSLDPHSCVSIGMKNQLNFGVSIQ